MKIRDLVIVGSGPAGYTAALYAARARLSPLVIAGETWGGQLMNTTQVENYPGFVGGIMGPALMNTMREQAKRFGAEIIDKNVSKVDFSRQPFRIFLGEGNKAQEYITRTAIITTGAKSRMLGIGEERWLGKGVSTCAVCDAPFYKDKVTYVVGGGDAAMEDTLALAKFAKRVILVHRRDQLRASKIMQRRVLVDNKNRVRVLWNSELFGVQGKNRLESILIKNNKIGSEKEFKADGLFIAVGHIPTTTVFKGELELDQKGYIITRLALSTKSLALAKQHVGSDGLLEFPTMTSVEGVFAAGDVVDFRYKQAVTAAGFGCMAALDAEKFLTGS